VETFVRSVEHGRREQDQASLALIASVPIGSATIASRGVGRPLLAGWSDSEIRATHEMIRYFGSGELIDGHALAPGVGEEMHGPRGISTDRPRFQPFDRSSFVSLQDPEPKPTRKRR
jgi:hypothetical protein